MKKAVLIFLFSIFLSIPVVLPFFHEGYFPTHDGEWAVVRLGDMFRTLRDFQIPPRYSGNLNFSYGYPLFNFTYPFPYYLGTLMHFLGIGFVDTIKILFAGSVPLSAFFIFLASRNIWKNTWAGIISATLYVYFPYRMVDLYVRGSIGESLSFALFPLLFYFTIKLIDKPSYFWILGISISLATLITTHNIMTVLFLPVWILFIVSKVILDKKKDSVKTIIIGIFLGLGLSAFFWVPAIFEKHLILLSKTPIADRNLYFVSLDQLILSRWGYGVPTDPNGFSYQLGLPYLIVISLTALVLFFILFRQKGKLKDSLTKFSLVLISIILFFIFLMTKPSSFLWESLPLLSEINYPWTVLGILGFLTSLSAGFLCKQKITKYIAVVLGLVAVVLVLPYAKPQYYVDRGDDFYLTNDATTTSSNELMPLWVKKMPIERPAEKVKVFGQGKVENISYNSKQISFSVDLLSQSRIRVNTIYYPGWTAKVNNQNAEINYANERGLMEFELSKGENKVELKFSETPLRFSAGLISLASFVVLLLYAITAQLRKKFIKARTVVSKSDL
ncbi:MAG: hypothetical protein HYT07_02045 [Candidatus Levybacteria bacterium]|nr:hypothetical protein [Candidatus Levybacteria bacterium]